MPFGAVYDACVLYPSALRDALIRFAMAGIVQAYWSEKILDETFDAITRNRPDLDHEKLARTRQLMEAALPAAMVEGHERLIPALKLPDENDRHVLAAAVHSRSQVIVTFNLRDFPASELDQFGVEARHPDMFLLDQFHISERTARAVVQAITTERQRRRPTISVEDVLDELESRGAIRFAAALRY